MISCHELFNSKQMEKVVHFLKQYHNTKEQGYNEATYDRARQVLIRHITFFEGSLGSRDTIESRLNGLIDQWKIELGKFNTDYEVQDYLDDWKIESDEEEFLLGCPYQMELDEEVSDEADSTQEETDDEAEEEGEDFELGDGAESEQESESESEQEDEDIEMQQASHSGESDSIAVRDDDISRRTPHLYSVVTGHTLRKLGLIGNKKDVTVSGVRVRKEGTLIAVSLRWSLPKTEKTEKAQYKFAWIGVKVPVYEELNSSSKPSYLPLEKWVDVQPDRALVQKPNSSLVEEITNHLVGVKAEIEEQKKSDLSGKKVLIPHVNIPSRLLDGSKIIFLAKDPFPKGQRVFEKKVLPPKPKRITQAQRREEARAHKVVRKGPASRFGKSFKKDGLDGRTIKGDIRLRIKRKHLILPKGSSLSVLGICFKDKNLRELVLAHEVNTPNQRFFSLPFDNDNSQIVLAKVAKSKEEKHNSTSFNILDFITVEQKKIVEKPDKDLVDALNQSKEGVELPSPLFNWEGFTQLAYNPLLNKPATDVTMTSVTTSSVTNPGSRPIKMPPRVRVTIPETLIRSEEKTNKFIFGKGVETVRVIEVKTDSQGKLLTAVVGLKTGEEKKWAINFSRTASSVPSAFKGAIELRPNGDLIATSNFHKVFQDRYEAKRSSPSRDTVFPCNLLDFSPESIRPIRQGEKRVAEVESNGRTSPEKKRRKAETHSSPSQAGLFAKTASSVVLPAIPAPMPPPPPVPPVAMSSAPPKPPVFRLQKKPGAPSLFLAPDLMQVDAARPRLLVEKDSLFNAFDLSFRRHMLKFYLEQCEIGKMPSESLSDIDRVSMRAAYTYLSNPENYQKLPRTLRENFSATQCGKYLSPYFKKIIEVFGNDQEAIKAELSYQSAKQQVLSSGRGAYAR